jgi:hypothetical protein
MRDRDTARSPAADCDEGCPYRTSAELDLTLHRQHRRSARRAGREAVEDGERSQFSHPKQIPVHPSARAARVLHLERKLLSSRKGAETSAAIFALRNADPNEWRDIKHTEEAFRQNIHRLTDAQLHAIAAQVAHPPDDAFVASFERTDKTGGTQ